MIMIAVVGVTYSKTYHHLKNVEIKKSDSVT